MESFVFALNAILPLIAMVLIGYFLVRIGFLPEGMPKMINKMVFRIFLPCMLFLNVYRIGSLSGISLGYVAFAIMSVLVIFALAIPLVMRITKIGARRGVVLQAVFRSNFALIGIPLAYSICGNHGTEVAAVLSAFTIPVFNVLAVISLSIFTGGKGRVSVKKILLDIVKNPLIESVLLGLIMLCIRAVFVSCDISWRLTEITPLFNVIESLSAVATPLALIALGGQFKFSAIGKMKRELIFAVVARTIAVPLVTLTTAYLFFDFDAAHFAAFIALFATPVAVSSVPMTQEMGGDTELAGQIVVWSTACSAFTIFLFTFIFRLIGVF